ncbi:MAG: PIN domain-containing protein [Gemmatimonadaceae bacterium]|nr:PIN domain-containing protein [Gemmatimonadaceae bacterium]
MIYTLDTNVVVDALRQPSEMEQLKAFLAWALPVTVLSSVVVAELAAGARTERARRALDEGLVGAFDRRARIHAPSRRAWHRTGAALGRIGASGVSASRQNDMLLAFQAREVGWMLITRDQDFAALRSVVRGLKVAASFPMRPTSRG